MHSVREEKPHNPDNSSLSDVIQLAQQGDVGAFELIYRLHCRRLHTLPAHGEGPSFDKTLADFRINKIR